MSLGGIKLVTFDATNTLLKFRVPPWQHYAIVARDHGFKGTGHEVKDSLLASYRVMWSKYPNFGKSKIAWEEWWRQVVKLTFEGKLPISANVDIIAERLIDEFKTSKCWYQAEGGNQLLQVIRKQGASVGVISNFDPRLTNILQSVNYHSSFDFILTSYEVGFSKPDKEIFNLAIEKCHKCVTPSESLHIGDDMIKDYEGARAAGWHALLITETGKTEKPPAREHVFNNLGALRVAIENKTLKL